ncbi:MAG: hypothetical protein AB1767_03890 [Bacillota bacterium]
MSCSSIKHQFDQLKQQGNLTFDKAVNLYNDLQGSLDAHGLELRELQKNDDHQEVERLQQHIEEGKSLLAQLKKMSLH